MDERQKPRLFRPSRHLSSHEYLGHCAQDKAGIGYYGWKDAELYTYQTEIVNESEL